MSDFVFHALIMIFGVVIAGCAQVLLKRAALQTYKHWIYQYLNVRVVAGYAIMVASTLCTVFAYRAVPLSMAPAFDSLGQIVVVTLSYIVLGERITKRKFIGLATIIIGILIFFI